MIPAILWEKACETLKEKNPYEEKKTLLNIFLTLFIWKAPFIFQIKTM